MLELQKNNLEPVRLNPDDFSLIRWKFKDFIIEVLPDKNDKTGKPNYRIIARDSVSNYARLNWGTGGNISNLNKMLKRACIALHRFPWKEIPLPVAVVAQTDPDFLDWIKENTSPSKDEGAIPNIWIANELELQLAAYYRAGQSSLILV